MAGSGRGGSPLDVFVEAHGEDVVEALSTLASEQRLAILVALWEASSAWNPTAEALPPAMSFSELYRRAGRSDTGQFAYHLKRLVGPFLLHDEAGYRLRPRARDLVATVVTGWARDDEGFEAEPTGSACPLCGAPLVADYRERVLVIRCPKCDGRLRVPGLDRGILARYVAYPAGLAGRTPQEFLRTSLTALHLRRAAMVLGVCPRCAGKVTVAGRVCPHHTGWTGWICDRCGSVYPVRWIWSCGVCRESLEVPLPVPPVLRDPEVVAFLRAGGLDVWQALAAGRFPALEPAVAEAVVRTRAPLRVEVAYVLDGRRLVVTMDDQARVVEAVEAP